MGRSCPGQGGLFGKARDLAGGPRGWACSRWWGASRRWPFDLTRNGLFSISQTGPAPGSRGGKVGTQGKSARPRAGSHWAGRRMCTGSLQVPAGLGGRVPRTPPRAAGWPQAGAPAPLPAFAGPGAGVGVGDSGLGVTWTEGGGPLLLCADPLGLTGTRPSSPRLSWAPRWERPAGHCGQW